ncbi:MAG: dockerin type I domain-containing protein [Christensenellales bacterium]
MKKRVIAPIALVLALLFAMCSVSVFAHTEQSVDKCEVQTYAGSNGIMYKDIDGIQYLDRTSLTKTNTVSPLTYNEHDVECVRNFMEQETNGVKNGLIINPNYDPDDPATFFGEGLAGPAGAEFDENGNLRIFSILYCGMSGTIDFSNCTSLTTCIIYENSITSLNVSGCTALQTLNTSFNYNLNELIIENTPGITELSCQYNYNITEIDITGMPNLRTLYLGCTPVKSIDASNSPNIYFMSLVQTDLVELNLDGASELRELYLRNTNISELDLAPFTSFNYPQDINGNDTLKSLSWKISQNSGESSSVLELNAEGNGGIGSYGYRIEAYPNPGAEFVGWFENGELFSTEQYVELQSLESSRSFTAVFEGGIELTTEAAIDIHRMRFLFNCYSMNGGGFALQGVLMNPEYDQYDVSTWTAVTFSENGRIIELNFDDLSFMGLIPLRDMTALEVLTMNNNMANEIRLFNNPALEAIYANGSSLNSIVGIDQAANLRVVQLNDTAITELDLSSNTLIEEVLCTNACVNEIHLAAESFNGSVDLFAVGNGYIGIEMTAENGLTITAEPMPDETFYGWCNQDGMLLSSEACISLESGSDYCLNAVFEQPGILGDANGNGVVSVEDALLVMRYVLELIPSDQTIMVSTCDMNNDGSIDFTDVTMILRLAMNIEN